ncbi:Xylulose kinase [Corynebacterium faecale]|uniref:gluconokinase n=1 Tax=Corynebacterium faecale TaxID=1758466 RepID=UPI0025B6198C|nr:gluconokinase [Corynebacterium faecale]WJY93433.1 Xylulose kinase [Corynebacterium faecale]
MGSIPTMSIPLVESSGPYLVAMDIGSTASRGGLYDRSGCPVKGSKQRVTHEFNSGEGGISTIDADQVVDEIRQVIDGLLEFSTSKDLNKQLGGVILDSFASSFILVDADGDALTPCVTYADARSARFVDRLREEIDEADYHERTGVRLHTSYHPSRLLWAKEEYPELFGKTHSVMTIGEYVYFKLAGIRGISTSVAAWSGILDAHTGELDLPIFEHIGVSPDLIAPIFDPDEPATPVKLIAEEYAPLAHVPWFHAIPDGWPSNVGPGALDERTVAVAAATSGAMRVILPSVPEHIPPGLWCYRLSRNECIVGGALNDVGRAVSWLEQTIAPVDGLPGILAGPPIDATPSVLPFFSGERSTGWASDATTVITNVVSQTGPAEMWRGVFEALALSYQRVWGEMTGAGAAPERVIASGRVATDHPTWLHMLCDALNTPVIPLEMKRATLRGTALIALNIIDPGGKRATPPLGEALQPEHVEYYRTARGTFDELYDRVIRTDGVD